MSTPPLEYMLTLCNLCVICNSHRFHSFIFELCTLKMCTGDTGPEQSYVLFVDN